MLDVLNWGIVGCGNVSGDFVRALKLSNKHEVK